MIQKRLYLTLILLISLSSCVHQIDEINKNITEKVIYSKTRSINQKVSIDINLEFPVYSSYKKSLLNKIISNEVNTIFESKNIKYKNDKLDKESLSKMIDKFISYTSKDYNDYETDMSELYINMKIDSVYKVNSVLVLEEKVESYMGGAHGSYSTKYFVYDINKEKLLSVKDLFMEKELTTIAYDYFLEERGLTKKDIDPEDERYWFKDNKFQLNENFMINAEKFIVLYNPYEIASYAEGQIVVEIPLSKLKNIIIDEYKYILK